jgi:exopolyphosphatase / guanosine-5'-triphosphate,3'-diphosphate pyrophosphatase
MTEDGIRPHTIAFMDFGTNSVRLLVVRIEPNQAYTVLHMLKESVRLGEGEFARQLLQTAAMDRAIGVAKRFAEVAQRADAEEIVAVGTAATREAENRDVFLRRLESEAGIRLHVVSGKEEARLIYLGVSSGLHLESQQALFVDIGGGSTETSIGTQREALYLNSLKVGAIRISNQFLRGMTGPVTQRLYERIKVHVRNEAARTLHDLRQNRIDLAYGSSGTIENLADIAVQARTGNPRQPGDVLSLTDLCSAVQMLCSLPLEQRRNVPGINPSRADIIVGGAAILETLMQELRVPEIRISERGLRDGLLVDYMARHGHADTVNAVPPRLRSVLQLGRSCRFNEEHAIHTTALALELFDSAKEAGLHALGEWERELLRYAASLHHIGSFLTYSGYQKHSHYLIRNADLLGFDQLEIALISLIALYHRGSLTRKKDPEYAALTPEMQRAVIEASTLLRLAENLDRGQTGAVHQARLRSESGRAVLQLTTSGDCQVELSGVEKQADIFTRVFAKRLQVQVTRDDGVSGAPTSLPAVAQRI